MGLFSRSKEAADGYRVDDMPSDALRRSPRRPRATRSDGIGDSSSPLDPAETAKSRARHRLIGAVALALAAVVFVPMLFDRAPVPTTDDIALQIPDRDSPFEGRRGVPDSASGPLKPSSSLPLVPPVPAAVAPVPTGASRSIVEPAAGPATPQPVQPVDVKPAEPGTADKVAVKPTIEKPADGNARAGQATDDPKALAALEGRSAGPSAASSEAAAGRTYAVQVAAYATQEKARGLREQLSAGGLKSYTEPVTTAQGVWIRVRLGPFPSRAAADEARQRLKSMKLDGSVVAL